MTHEQPDRTEREGFLDLDDALLAHKPECIQGPGKDLSPRTWEPLESLVDPAIDSPLCCAQLRERAINIGKDVIAPRLLTGTTPEDAIAARPLAQGVGAVAVCPRPCPIPTTIEVIVDGSQPEVWFSLRAVALARERALAAGVAIQVRVTHCPGPVLSQALRHGLVDAATGEPSDGEDGSATPGSQAAAQAAACAEPGCALICWVGAGLISADFLVQLALSAALDPKETYTIFHPGRLVFATRDGGGIQLEHVEEFDPFVLMHSTTQLPVFAFHRALAARFETPTSHAQRLSEPGRGSHQRWNWTAGTALRLFARISAAGHKSWGIAESLVVLRLAPEAAQEQKNCLVALQCLGTPVSDCAVWLHLAQENLRPIALHADLAAFDWNSLPLVRQSRGAFLECAVIELLQSQLKSETAHVLLIPWLKRGGADRAAISYMQSLAARVPGRVLAITTERADSAWAARVPEGAKLIDWAMLAPWRDVDHSRQNLSWMLARLGASTIHVMNSRLGWEALAHEGQRLNAVAHTYASLFWYGPSEHRKLWGYASEYAERVTRSGAVDAFLTDNETFPRRLNEDYGIPPHLFHCVRHPTMHFADGPIARSPTDRPTVLWGSRFAPEKRMDLLLEIARQRPVYTFLVFGSNDGSHPELDELAMALRCLPNVILPGAYDGFESLPLQACDAFLYTSSSDGMPNVVIEALAHGLPLVAPDVGGVAELIDETTGWLVHDIDDVSAYLNALDTLLNDAPERFLRASNGLVRVRSLHSQTAFANRLAQIPGYAECGGPRPSPPTD